MANETKDIWIKLKPKVLAEEFINEVYLNNGVQRFEFWESEDKLVIYVNIFFEDGRNILRFYDNN